MTCALHPQNGVQQSRRVGMVSNSGMTAPPPESATDARLTELEIKASFTEDLVEQLNQVVIRQQQQIDLLLRELVLLKEQQRNSGGGEFRSLRDERPPHY